MTSPSSWTQKGTDQEWTSHMLVDPSGPPPPPPPVCDCSPSHQSLDMTYAEPDGMGGHTYNTIGTVYWEDTPDCRYYNASMIVGGECIMTYDDPTDTWSIEWNGLTFGPSGNCNNPIAYYNEPNNPGHHMITSA